MANGVVSNTLKPLTNAHAVRGRPTLNDDGERTFRNGSFRELEANVRSIMRSNELNELSMSTAKSAQTLTTNDKCSLTNLGGTFTRTV